MAKKPKAMEDVYKTTDKFNRHDEKNRERLNPTPVEPPLGYKAAPSLAEQIRLQVRQLKHLEDNEPETEEEADDFDIEEDPAPESRWENDFIPSIKETRKRLKELEEAERREAARSAKEENEDLPKVLKEQKKKKQDDE